MNKPQLFEIISKYHPHKCTQKTALEVLAVEYANEGDLEKLKSMKESDNIPTEVREKIENFLELAMIRYIDKCCEEGEPYNIEELIENGVSYPIRLYAKRKLPKAYRKYVEEEEDPINLASVIEKEVLDDKTKKLAEEKIKKSGTWNLTKLITVYDTSKEMKKKVFNWLTEIYAEIGQIREFEQLVEEISNNEELKGIMPEDPWMVFIEACTKCGNYNCFSKLPSQIRERIDVKKRTKDAYFNLIDRLVKKAVKKDEYAIYKLEKIAEGKWNEKMPEWVRGLAKEGLQKVAEEFAKELLY